MRFSAFAIERRYSCSCSNHSVNKIALTINRKAVLPQSRQIVKSHKRFGGG